MGRVLELSSAKLMTVLFPCGSTTVVTHVEPDKVREYVPAVELSGVARFRDAVLPSEHSIPWFGAG